MKVKRSLLLVAVGCGALAFAVLQQVAQKYVLLDDKKGGFKVYDVESALTSFVPNGDVEFDASGRPMKGFSKEQGLSFSALKMEGLASRTDAGSFRIKRGSASGSVVVDLASSADSGATAPLAPWSNSRRWTRRQRRRRRGVAAQPGGDPVEALP